MRRRAFLQAWLGLPLLGVRSRPQLQQASDVIYRDSETTADLAALRDADLATGVEYQP